MVGRDPVEPDGLQFLLLLVIMIMLLGAIGVAGKIRSRITIRSRSEMAAKEPRFHLRTSRAMRNGSTSPAGVAELADALDSKSSTRKSVWVRTPPPALSPAIPDQAPRLTEHRPPGPAYPEDS